MALKTFEKYKHVYLCNCIYNIITKIIARRVKRLLSNSISSEQLRFLEGKKIHQVVEVAKDILHTIKVKNSKLMVIKFDLSKDYDRVSWMYLR